MLNYSNSLQFKYKNIENCLFVDNFSKTKDNLRTILNRKNKLKTN